MFCLFFDDIERPILAGQFDDIVSQLLFIRATKWNLALCGSVLPQGAVGPTFGCAELLPHKVVTPAAA